MPGQGRLLQTTTDDGLMLEFEGGFNRSYALDGKGTVRIEDLEIGYEGLFQDGLLDGEGEIRTPRYILKSGVFRNGICRSGTVTYLEHPEYM